MKTLKNLGLALSGIIVAILIYLGLRSDDEISDEGLKILDERANELESQLEKLDQQEKELNENGVKDLTPEEEFEYWEGDDNE